MAEYGLYYLNKVRNISDSSSTYYNNSASVGGVYYITTSSTMLSKVTLSSNEYKYIYASAGAIVSIQNYF
jgi:hypothetical protein